MAYVPRWVDLDGVVNMRDLGGITTESGRMIATGVLLRSDNLAEITEETQRTLLDDYALSDVIDLRTNRERKGGLGPLGDSGRVTTSAHSLYAEDDPDAEEAPWRGPHEAPKVIDPHLHAQFLAAHYAAYLAQRPDSIIDSLRTIANADGGVLVHCAAGKDRTGVIIAFVLAALGVDRHTIVADYAASTDRVEQIVARLGAEAAAGTNEHDLRPEAQTTPPETMEALIDTVDQRFGGMRAWLALTGWTDADQAALEAKLLA